MTTSNNTPYLPYARQSIDDDDIAAVSAVLRGDWLTTGPAVEAFEGELLRRVGARYAVVCSSGTAALHLATLALNLGPGDAAIVPATTFVATANCVRYVGGEVLFADVDPATGLMTEAGLADAIGRAGALRLRAVLPVHMAGQCYAPAALRSVAQPHGLAIIEDAAHAIGTTYEAGGQRFAVGACAHSDQCVFSFHPAKTVTMAEGGAVTTNDPRLADRLRQFRTHGITRDAAQFANAAMARDPSGRVNPWYHEMQELGFNYRATDLQCALGLSQLRKLDRFVARRAALVRRYDERLAEFAPLIRPLGRMRDVSAGWHLYVARIDFAALGRSRAAVMDALRACGIGTQVHYIPVHRQPYYRARYGAVSLPGADEYYGQALSLPLYADMADGDVDRVAAALGEILRESGMP